MVAALVEHECQYTYQFINQSFFVGSAKSASCGTGLLLQTTNYLMCGLFHYLQTIFVCHIYSSVQKHGQAEVLGMASRNKVVQKMEDLCLAWLLHAASFMFYATSILLADDIVNYNYKVMIYPAIMVQTRAALLK